MKSVSDILAEAKRLAENSKTWADLSNALFDPLDGLIIRTFPDADERSAFRKSDACEALHKLVERKMQVTGVLAGSEPKKSGKFVVRVPRTLHAALEQEAIAEGTSLNQLVLAKLAAQLGSLAGGRVAAILQAFGEVRDGYSADRVVADPNLDRRYLRRCRELNLGGTDFDLNWGLLNARKSGLLSELPKTKKYTLTETDAFEYASELAVRFMQRTKDVSLDQIICDPDLAAEFDEHAAQLAPGHLPLEYRWVAFGLRKAGRLQSGAAAKIDLPQLSPVSQISRLDVSSLPVDSGVYLFSSAGSPIFVSQTENLRRRLEQHLHVSDSLGLPDWLWQEGPLDLSIARMPRVTRALRQTVEIILVKKLHPILNYQRAA